MTSMLLGNVCRDLQFIMFTSINTRMENELHAKWKMTIPLVKIQN